MNTPADSHPSHWDRAAQLWRYYGPPLRPCTADIDIMQALVHETYARNGGRPLKALMLGVTPEIATMAWPASTHLCAIDCSDAMIRIVWPGDIAGQRVAICADWLEYPASGEQYDIVIGDGNFAIIEPARAELLASKARSLLHDDGLFIARSFVSPSHKEAPAQVLEDLAARRIQSIHAFKFRLAMALQEDSRLGVRLADVWEAWDAAHIDYDQLAATNGWTLQSIAMIDLYKNSDSRLWFPTAAELRAVIGARFDLVDERYGAYEMSDRCPTFGYRPRLGE